MPTPALSPSDGERVAEGRVRGFGFRSGSNFRKSLQKVEETGLPNKICSTAQRRRVGDIAFIEIHVMLG
jgi:ribosomal protein L37AE/L43A